MLIVDSQVHIWSPDTPERPSPTRSSAYRPEPLSADALLKEMHEAGVDRAVLVPPAPDGDRNDLALAAAHAHPERFAVMGRLDPLAPASRDILPSWLEQRGMLGLRLNVSTPPLTAALPEGHLDWLWRDAEEYRVPIYVLVAHSMVHLIDAVAERHPQLKLVIDHMGLTGHTRDAQAFRDFDKVLGIARRPNVAAKLSALPTFSTDKYPYRSLHPYIRKACDGFGSKRLFWGTDLTRSPIPYRQRVTLFTEELPWLTTTDLEWIMGRGLCEWIGWSESR
jgi:L-fuconolactonase